VLHDGFKDTHTFDAVLNLVHTAKQRLLLVNTFPLVLELQRALARAIGRGVEVRFLFGNVRPRWGADNVLFHGGAVRALGDNLVRARLDPLLRAGARGYEFGTPHPELGTLWPHVHAKVFIRDEETVAIGSANLDVTSSYWESEAMLLIHSRLVDATASSWARDADRRRWLARAWPSIVS
jgi:phosphatidylserine/phosphatidylglycerophosphate/cardiolipin synthase-like enzyme